MSNIFKSIRVREIFSNMLCHLLFGKVSHSKVSDLLHLGQLSNSYFEILTVE